MLLEPAIDCGRDWIGSADDTVLAEAQSKSISQLFTRDGFAEKVRDTQANQLRSCFIVVPRRDHDNRNAGTRWIGFERPANLKAVHIGEHQIEKDGVDMPVLNQPQTLSPRLRFKGIESLSRQMPKQDGRGVWIIVNDQYLWLSRRLLHRPIQRILVLANIALRQPNRRKRACF